VDFIDGTAESGFVECGCISKDAASNSIESNIDSPLGLDEDDATTLTQPTNGVRLDDMTLASILLSMILLYTVAKVCMNEPDKSDDSPGASVGNTTEGMSRKKRRRLRYNRNRGMRCGDTPGTSSNGPSQCQAAPRRGGRARQQSSTIDTPRIGYFLLLTLLFLLVTACIGVFSIFAGPLGLLLGLYRIIAFYAEKIEWKLHFLSLVYAAAKSYLHSMISHYHILIKVRVVFYIYNLFQLYYKYLTEECHYHYSCRLYAHRCSS
jgi:hypothetical protein